MKRQAADDDFQNIAVPVDLVRYSVGQVILLKMRNDRLIRGRLHAYDQHLNMILSDVEENSMKAKIDDETYEQVYEKEKRKIPILFLRGDGIILISVDSPTNVHM